MSRKLFWKLCLIIATGVVALFYFINLLTSRTEEGMSYLAIPDRQALNAWGKEAEQLYNAGDLTRLNNWVENLKQQENTWVAIAQYDIGFVSGSALTEDYYQGNVLGRNVDWKIHLYFAANPVMSVPFTDQQVSLLIQLPDRMRPGTYWRYTKITFQIVLPAILLALLSFVLYRHIIKPMRQLQLATHNFSRGNFNVRAKEMMGNRSDEFSELAETFDQMAARIGEQIVSQRQLIADLSHELRTPLTRLDIALAATKEQAEGGEHLARINRESKHIRTLVEDTLTLAWLENEQPELQQESVEVIDLLDVLIDDARFEFPKQKIVSDLPNSAIIENSSHRAAGQAIENILRNALRYTPIGKMVSIALIDELTQYHVIICDEGPGIPSDLLTTIFKPFFRVDKSRERDGSSFGLGLALAKRQLAAIRGDVIAENLNQGGLKMIISLPKA